METKNLTIASELLEQMRNDEARGLLPKGYCEWVEEKLK